MKNPLTTKLQNFARLSFDDKAALDEFARAHVRHYDAREDIMAECQNPRAMNLVLDGWVCRYKTLEDGRRQIINFMLPGDLCDLYIFLLRHMDHAVGALTAARVAQVTRQEFDGLTLERPRLTQALLWESLVATAIQREWTVNVGQRNATERVAHLLCEIFVRLKAVDMVSDNACAFPITQADLADASGLSLVHLNRTVQDLRSSELIVLRHRTLIIPDFDALKRTASFNANYLHLNREGEHLDANEGTVGRDGDLP